jgi:hypothetical protein
MSTATHEGLEELRAIIPSVEMVDPEAIAELEKSYEGKRFWILLPDMASMRGEDFGVRILPAVKAQVASGEEFGVSRDQAAWVRLIYSDALTAGSCTASTACAVKKHVYNPRSRHYQLVVQKWNLKTLKDTLANIATKYKETLNKINRMLPTLPRK